MAIFKCKMCGGTIEFNAGDTVGVCDSCGTKQTLPRLDDDKRANLYDRANHYRRSNDFDKAISVYEQILDEDGTDAEAYWSLVLCRYGIEYVEDPVTRKRVPTVNRAQFTSIYMDEDYKSALKYASSDQKIIYEQEAAAIDDIQKGILEISSKEEPFDVFICYKETDENGRRTRDSVLATELYHQLTMEGFKVFFSRITLEDKLGIAYEPYIFAALNSAKVMVVIGTKPEYFNAVWVKNEWSRYLTLVRQSNGKKVLIPAYRDMDPYNLPEEFSHLQAQDMSKLGFMQDLIRGVKKIAGAGGRETAVKETVSFSGTVAASITPILERAFIFLEDGNYQEADEYCEKALDQDPKNARAYLGKLMAEMKVRRVEDLDNCSVPFDNSNNYQKALRFGDEKLKSTLKGYYQHVKERCEAERLERIYNDGKTLMGSAKSEAEYREAAQCFEKIPDYKDAGPLYNECLRLAEDSAKDAVYAAAKKYMTDASTKSFSKRHESAISLFETIRGWRDADEQIEICRKKIAQMQAAKEENERKAREKKRKMRILFAIVAAACIVVIVAVNITKSAIKSSKYNEAIKLYNAGKYEEAITAFEALDGYKDSSELADDCFYGKQKSRLTNVRVGSVIKFGAYEQNNVTSDGREEIEWLVLAVENNKALLISRYALDCKPYNEDYKTVTWGTCSLRTWLNDDFYKKAFGKKHRGMIKTANVSADRNPNYDTNPGNATQDKVFLLGITEVNKYFTSDESRKCVPTAYAKANGAYTSSSYKVDGKETCWWWLRSPGDTQYGAAYVVYDGSVYHDGYVVDNDDYCVRPALWITLDS